MFFFCAVLRRVLCVCSTRLRGLSVFLRLHAIAAPALRVCAPHAIDATPLEDELTEVASEGPRSTRTPPPRRRELGLVLHREAPQRQILRL